VAPEPCEAGADLQFLGVSGVPPCARPGLRRATAPDVLAAWSSPTRAREPRRPIPRVMADPLCGCGTLHGFEPDRSGPRGHRRPIDPASATADSSPVQAPTLHTWWTVRRAGPPGRSGVHGRCHRLSPATSPTRHLAPVAGTPTELDDLPGRRRACRARPAAVAAGMRYIFGRIKSRPGRNARSRWR